jgi:hypothetical protein
MPPATTPDISDQALLNLLTTPPPSTIPEVIALMEAIDAILPPTDGLRWFNQLYLMVTRQVDLHPPGGQWQSPIWLTRLDVVFANLYFSAVANFLGGETIPSAWSALFESRDQPGIDRILFALAGMNAHINHDLALALVSTDAELTVTPAPASPEYADYQSVNTLLRTLMPATLNMLATDTLGVLAEDTGKIGRVLAFWDICQARNLAWDFANQLRNLPTPLQSTALAAQDSLTGVVGRAILAIQ